MARKTEVTFELEETLILKKGGKPEAGFCPRCQTEVGFVLPEVLAALASTTEREIFRLIEAGTIYFIEKTRLTVCTGCYAKAIADSSGEIQVADLLESE